MKRKKNRAVVGLIVLLACLSGVSLSDGDEKTDQRSTDHGTYEDALLEKVGEVSEIRYRELVESESDRADGEKALLRLALYRYFQGDFAGAEYLLRQLVDRSEGTYRKKEARLWIGRTYLARGEYRSALVELRGGLEEMGDSTELDDILLGRYLFWVGEAYRLSGMAADARHSYESFLERVPDHPLAVILRQRLVETYRALGMEPAGIESNRGSGDTSPAGEEVKTVVPVRYRVRVGSFSVRENASRLVQSLGKAGFEAEIEEVTLETGRYYRVVLGRFENREKAEEYAGKLRREGYPKAYVEETR